MLAKSATSSSAASSRSDRSAGRWTCRRASTACSCYRRSICPAASSGGARRRTSLTCASSTSRATCSPPRHAPPAPCMRPRRANDVRVPGLAGAGLLPGRRDVRAHALAQVRQALVRLARPRGALAHAPPQAALPHLRLRRARDLRDERRRVARACRPERADVRRAQRSRARRRRDAPEIYSRSAAHGNARGRPGAMRARMRVPGAKLCAGPARRRRRQQRAHVADARAARTRVPRPERRRGARRDVREHIARHRRRGERHPARRRPSKTAPRTPRLPVPARGCPRGRCTTRRSRLVCARRRCSTRR